MFPISSDCGETSLPRELLHFYKVYGDPAVDIDFSLCFLPLSSKRTLGIVYTEMREAKALWLSHPEVSSFSYWNNTDRPDDISAEEWRKRKQAWDKALPPSGIPAEKGFSLQLLSNGFTCFVPSASDLIQQALAPNFSDSKPKLLSRLIEAHLLRMLSKKGQSLRPSEYMAWFKSLSLETRIASPTGLQLQALLNPVHDFTNDAIYTCPLDVFQSINTTAIAKCLEDFTAQLPPRLNPSSPCFLSEEPTYEDLETT